MSERFEIVFLGTGGPLPNADRCGAGPVVVAGDTNVLIDCGWGAASRLVPSGVTPSSIEAALFTHMHSDHITDVPDFTRGGLEDDRIAKIGPPVPDIGTSTLGRECLETTRLP